MRIAVVDVETTGFGRQHVVWQIASALVDTHSRVISEPVHLEIQLTPEELEVSSEKALEVSGWSEERNANARNRDEVLQLFSGWLQHVSPVRMCAHNARFDRRMCVEGRLVPADMPWACTMLGIQSFQRLNQCHLENNKLATLAGLCGYNQTRAHENALDDVYASANGLLYLLHAGVPIEQMFVPKQ